jgi:hypothetical protein
VLRLLRRTLPLQALGTQRTGSYQGFVRFASITHTNTQYDLFTEPVPPAASAASHNPAASAAPTYLQPRHRLLPCRSATSKITSITRPNASVPFSLLRPLQATNTTIYASHHVRHRNQTSELGQWDHPNRRDYRRRYHQCWYHPDTAIAIRVVLVVGFLLSSSSRGS